FLTVYAACYFAGFMARSYALVAEHAPGVWVMDPRTASSDQFVNMASSAFDRVRSIAGVASAERLVVGAVDARLPDGRLQPFQIIGLDDASLAGLPRNPGGDGYALLRRPDAAIIDAGGSEGKLDFHDPAQGPRQLRPGDLLEA
ncbi:hypothetical protein N4Q63_27065, partial [Leclercia adecarboxylata]|uniref:hypothetical protein n=1 Tax=Leclercia adecarboxylata TaxID=83655 RepID=UPI00234C99FB|nr:hypothetical protein [Leclercia adecarboxylata]